MSKPKWSHYQAVVRIQNYVKGTLMYGILFPSRGSDEVELIFYSNYNWCGDKVDRKSTTRYLFKYLGAPISWCSKKQLVVALSTCEDEYRKSQMEFFSTKNQITRKS